MLPGGKSSTYLLTVFILYYTNTHFALYNSYNSINRLNNWGLGLKKTFGLEFKPINKFLEMFDLNQDCLSVVYQEYITN